MFEISKLSQSGGAAWEGQSRGNGQGRGGIGKVGLRTGMVRRYGGSMVGRKQSISKFYKAVGSQL